jgi:LPXTG-motif cell wall-anchored protein
MRKTRGWAMKRIVGTALVLVTVLLTPLTAFAQEGSGLNPPEGPDVLGTGGSVDPGGVAFTGAETFQLILLAVALFVLGASAIFLSRRRRVARMDT